MFTVPTGYSLSLIMRGKIKEKKMHWKGNVAKNTDSRYVLLIKKQYIHSFRAETVANIQLGPFIL